MASLFPLENAPPGGGAAQRRARLAGLAFTVSAMLGVLVTTLAKGNTRLVAGMLLVLCGYALAGALVLRGSRHLEGRNRTGWGLLGVALLIAATGLVVFAVSYALNPDLPTFGWTDVFFLTTYALSLAAFATFPHVRAERSQWIRIWLDGLVGGVSLAVILWTFVVARLLDQMQGIATWRRIVASAYPILDLIMLTVVIIVVVRRSALRFDLRMILLGAAIASQAVSDLYLLTRGATASFSSVEPPFAILGVAVGFFIAVGLMIPADPERREYAERRPSLVAMVAPYGIAFILVILLVQKVTEVQRMVTASAGPSPATVEEGILFVGFLVVTALVVARQAVAIRENRELVEAQRRALVSSVSHELRTPLSAVVGFLDLLAGDDPDGFAPEERAELVDMAYGQAKHMARIIGDLVLLARDDLSQMSIEEKPLRAAEVVEPAIAAVDAPGVRFLDETGDRMILADSDRLRQVVINLLNNAVRYGGPTRLVVARTLGSLAAIEVHDDGAGVPKRYEYSIWERFERGAHRLDATTPGSGVGLSVVDAIARAHGGVARYRRSERLGGACFSVELPERAVPATADDEVATWWVARLEREARHA